MLSQLITFTILLISVNLQDPQDLLGLDSNRIKTVMAGEKPGMVYDENTVNRSFSYLRYRSKDETETWLIFLDDDGKCKGVRVTCDNIRLEEKRKELNSHFTAESKNKWICKTGNGEAAIELKEETWFFTVTYKPPKKKR